MNNDLISREALKNVILNDRKLDGVNANWEVNRILVHIDNAPTVDTTCPHCDSGYAQGYSDGYLRGKEERPQGEWIVFYTPKKKKVFKCDKCMAVSIQEQTNFCPNCGAEMKGGAE